MAIAAPFLIVTFAMVVLAVPIQIINIVYRNHSAIKANSPHLNHLIFFGCYLTVMGTMLYIIRQKIDADIDSNLCVTVSWFFSVGTSLIIGTVCMKTWRLYRIIYTSSKRVHRLRPRFMSDPWLAGPVLCSRSS